MQHDAVSSKRESVKENERPQDNLEGMNAKSQIRSLKAQQIRYSRFEHICCVVLFTSKNITSVLALFQLIQHIHHLFELCS